MSVQSPPVAETVAPAEIELTINGQPHWLSYEHAFALGCTLLDKGQSEQASKVFERLETFTDRGPRAFIMQAFCEAAAGHYDRCSAALCQAFPEDVLEVAETLHSVFVFYHVASRKEAIRELIELVNKHHELPTLCLLLGDMLAAADNAPLARKCWKQAVRRDRAEGAVAAVAKKRLTQAGVTGGAESPPDAAQPAVGHADAATVSNGTI
jgi:tetratricopeptide (TPR) repeat protein